MKQFALLTAVCLTLGSSVFGQKQDSLQAASRQQEHLNVYRRSLQYDDMHSAAYALTNYLLAGGSANFRDSLAIIYYRTGNLNGSYKLAKEINEGDAKNVTALTLLADISGRAGDTKASLDWYEKLCPLAPDPYNYYQLATRQFILERVGECRSTLQKVLADSAKARQEQVALEVSPGRSENVPVIAAAYNMLGALAFRDKKGDEAKKFYEMAVKEFPDFIIARQNLEGMKPATNGGKAPAKTPAAKPKS